MFIKLKKRDLNVEKYYYEVCIFCVDAIWVLPFFSMFSVLFTHIFVTLPLYYSHVYL